jgi:hypothetical protein
MRNNRSSLSIMQRQASNFFTTVLDSVKGTYTGLTQHHVMTAGVQTQYTPLKKY